MGFAQHVAVPSRSLDELRELIDAPAFDAFERSMRNAAEALRGRTVWNVNSSAEGGGVAEMLKAILPYEAGAGWDVRRIVIGGDEAFFEVTKRLHYALHGIDGSGELEDTAGR